MVQYRYAGDSRGKIVDAEELAKIDRRNDWEFICLGCNRVLIAKVHGEHHKPHFAHHPGATCSDETYLHRLGKKVFAEEFAKCRESGEPFTIELSYPLFCRKFEGELGQPCQISQTHVKTHDLASLFNEIHEERRDGSFIPDLLLVDTDRTHFKVFIEIAVTHFLSDKKERSGERIIEIPIDSEEDLSKIRSRCLTSQNCRFVNFGSEGRSVSDSECVCETCMAYAFVVWKSGKAVLDQSTLGDLVSRRRRNQGDISYFRLICVDRLSRRLPSASDAFRDAVQQARRDGFALKNCYLCRYQGDNFNGDSLQPIYCKCFKKTCGSNEAVSCHAFRQRADSPDDFPRL